MVAVQQYVVATYKRLAQQELLFAKELEVHRGPSVSAARARRTRSGRHAGSRAHRTHNTHSMHSTHSTHPHTRVPADHWPGPVTPSSGTALCPAACSYLVAHTPVSSTCTGALALFVADAQVPRDGDDKENGVGEGVETLGNGLRLGVGFNHDLSQARIPMHACKHCDKTFASPEYLAA
jgi:hypothetical protein